MRISSFEQYSYSLYTRQVSSSPTRNFFSFSAHIHSLFSFIHSLVPLSIHLPINSFICSFIHSFIRRWRIESGFPLGFCRRGFARSEERRRKEDVPRRAVEQRSSRHGYRQQKGSAFTLTYLLETSADHLDWNRLLEFLTIKWGLESTVFRVNSFI